MEGRFMKARPVVFGEVLFDCFPDGRRVLGGAPFNVAWHLQAFGLSPLMVSRVGDDEAGMNVLDAMRDWGMDRRGMQVDRELPTGAVEVRFDDGEPSYEIVHPSAWDAIATEPFETPVSLLYHGSLALRDARSAESLAALRDAADAPVFMDVNLRAPWWAPDAVLQRARGSQWLKLNADELRQLGGEGPLEAMAAGFLAAQELTGLVVTLGAEGAMVLRTGGSTVRSQPPPAIEVRDTVGAGDALTAVMICGLLKGWSLAQTLDRALAFAGAICGRRGAIVRDQDFYAPFLAGWGIEAENASRV
jgi:fructokinase